MKSIYFSLSWICCDGILLPSALENGLSFFYIFHNRFQSLESLVNFIESKCCKNPEIMNITEISWYLSFGEQKLWFRASASMACFFLLFNV